MALNNHIESLSGALRNSCIRCGTCCEKGGPAFHLEDRSLIDTGIIHTRELYTIRQGELVHDNVRNLVMPNASEMIKIKGVGESWQCTFYQEKVKGCGIYKQRPLECRVLKCWDPSELSAIYDKNRLTRRDLLADIVGLWDLVETHERECSYVKLKRSLDDLGGSFNHTAVKAVVTMVRYDQEIRRMVASQGGVEPAMTDFLFGHPMEKTMERFGYGFRNRDGKYMLVRL